MIKTVSCLWRWFFTMLGYVLYGGSSLLATIIFVIPFLLLPQKISKKTSQFLMYLSYWCLSKFLVYTGVMRIKIINKELLQDLKGVLVIANHPSFLDIVVLMSFLKKADCIVKPSLWSNPVLGFIVRTSQYIKNENPLQLINACIERLQDGFNVVIFPEGTRSPENGLQDFKRGFATIAIGSHCKVLPIFLRCSPPAFTKNSPCYSVPEKRFEIFVYVFPPILLPKMDADKTNFSAESKRLHQQIESFYQEISTTEVAQFATLYHQYFAKNEITKDPQKLP